MDIKRKISAVTAAAMLIPCTYANTFLSSANAEDEEPAPYTYEIIPLLEPFNEYFFVRTDDPDPANFRFYDKDSKYSDKSALVLEKTIFADVDYEDPEIYRVNGGYIFHSFTTDGGEVELQHTEKISRREFNEIIYGEPDPEMTGYSPSDGDMAFYNFSDKNHYKWVDTGVTVTIPDLVDDCDYLIDTYATEEEFFDNMTAVQKGFSDICLYSGSYIRGTVVRQGTYWFVSNSPHIDQKFYIQSPYRRQDDQSLFASSLYPYRYDSWGFPSMMGSVSKRLSSDSSYKWSNSNHYTIEVTYNGETKTYGGQGNGKGQGVDAEQMLYKFSFGDDAAAMTAEESKKLLTDYAALEVTDDVPKDDELTWSYINHSAGDGTWMKIYGGYAFMYDTHDVKEDYYTDEVGVGGSIYWWGSLGYCYDTWVDGRYIGKYEVFRKGDKFEDHPESDIMLLSVTYPLVIDYKTDWVIADGKKVPEYSCIAATKTQGNLLYKYDSEKEKWIADVDYEIIRQGVEKEELDPEYLDMLELTLDEVLAMGIDRNSDVDPMEGLLYDGSAEPGTPFRIIPVLKGDANKDGEVNIADLVTLEKWLLGADEEPDTESSDLYEDGILDSYDLILLRQQIISGLDSGEESTDDSDDSDNTDDADDTNDTDNTDDTDETDNTDNS